VKGESSPLKQQCPLQRTVLVASAHHQLQEVHPDGLVAGGRVQHQEHYEGIGRGCGLGAHLQGGEYLRSVQCGWVIHGVARSGLA
jgi:hypothetical protein